VGALAASTNTANDNVAVGSKALQNATSGGNNVAVGSSALGVMTVGTGNVAVGFNAGRPGPGRSPGPVPRGC
jgi:hypothetical protein